MVPIPMSVSRLAGPVFVAQSTRPLGAGLPRELHGMIIINGLVEVKL